MKNSKNYFIAILLIGFCVVENCYSLNVEIIGSDVVANGAKGEIYTADYTRSNGKGKQKLDKPTYTWDTHNGIIAKINTSISTPDQITCDMHNYSGGTNPTTAKVGCSIKIKNPADTGYDFKQIHR